MERKVKGTRRGMRYDCKGKWDTAPQTGREGIGNYVRQMRHFTYLHLWVCTERAKSDWLVVERKDPSSQQPLNPEVIKY